MAPQPPERYRTLDRMGRSQTLINKSRFFGYAGPALTEGEAQSFIEEVHAQHPDASCVCYGYLCGFYGLPQRFYDGHEPVGGMPILDCLKKQGLTGCVCAVARYFGGVKLGAGGLARAFGGAAALAVADARPCEREKSLRYLAEFEYSNVGKVEYYFKQVPYRLERTEFGEKVTATILIPAREEQAFTHALGDLLAGRVDLEAVERCYAAWDETTS